LLLLVFSIVISLSSPFVLFSSGSFSFFFCIRRYLLHSLLLLILFLLYLCFSSSSCFFVTSFYRLFSSPYAFVSQELSVHIANTAGDCTIEDSASELDVKVALRVCRWLRL
jgi:hypothetical protein